MKQYNITVARMHLSELVKLALQGEEILIARGNKPLIKLTPLNDPLKKRMPGTGKGEVLSVAQDFDELPEDFEELEETAYLLRSPKNVRRLIESIAELESGKATGRELLD